jgi:hypothetical protein
MDERAGGLFRRPAYFLDALILARRSQPINPRLATHEWQLAASWPWQATD